MGRTIWFGILTAFLAGCAPTAKERVQAYNEDGVHLFRQGQYRDAAESFQAGLKVSPEEVGLLYNAGECYDHVGDKARAEQFYNDCLQRAPNHAPCRHALAVLLVSQGRRQDAVNMVEGWLTLAPERPDALVEEAWLWRQSGNLPACKKLLELALEKDPHHNRALVELAQVYETMHRPQRALVLYERALEQQPRQRDVIDRRNFLLTQLKPEDQRPKPD